MSTTGSALAILLSALSIAVPMECAAAEAFAQHITVQAIAADVHAFVGRAEEGKLRSYAVGTLITPDWRVARVTDGAVTLGWVKRLNGQTVEITLHSGESADLDGDAARVAQSREVRQTPVSTRVTPTKRKPETGR